MTQNALEALLAPISPDAPSGTEECYSPECDEIRRLRKGDDPSLSQGDWVREIQTPQWPKVRDLCEMMLTTRTKDLQIACWHAEAIAYLEGFPGLSMSLKLIHGLLVDFTDTFYPVDPDERIAKLEWFNNQLPMVIRNIPMTSPKFGGYSHMKWEESRMVENLGVRDAKAKETAIAEGKLTGEAWDRAATSSGQTYYLRLSEQVQNARRDFDELETRVDDLFGQDAPSLQSVREALQGCQDLTAQMMKKFGLDPSIEAAYAPSASTFMETPAPSYTAPGASPVMAQVAVPSGPIASRADAIRKLREVAHYFRVHEPHSPVGPLAERAARWGEMPLEQWLSKVIKDEGTLGQLRDLLDLQPAPEE